MNLFRNKIIASFLLVAFLLPVSSAEARFRDELGGWVPYWIDNAALRSVERNMDDIDILYPFIYEIEGGGDIVAKVDIEDGAWKDLLDEADDERVEIIPTIAWFDGEAIQAVLSDRKQRRALVDDIEDLVDDNHFDGINIDFEQKWSETIDYYSTFLKELDDALGHDELTCTIEARTPPESRWREVPERIEWANDYEAMNRYCDWVEIMAYDQQRADIKLNRERRGVPYVPVADADWVEKVIEYALEDIDADKIILGIPTYGRAWDVTVAPEWYRDYNRVASLNHSRILELSEKYEVPIGRSEGGEGVISYFPEDSVYKLFNQLEAPAGTPKGYEAAAKALMVATYANVEVPVRFVSFSDAAAVEDKLDLVEKYNLKGAAFFSFNGEEDAEIWDLF